MFGVENEDFTNLSDEIYIPTISINGVPSETSDGVASGDVNEEKTCLRLSLECTFTRRC